jgi:MoxR-like ATPase
VNSADILEMQSTVENVFLSGALYRYIAELTAATRINPLIKLGSSPRGSIALAKMSQASAFLSGKDFVIPEDVRNVFEDVIVHRILLNSQAKMNNTTQEQILKEIIKEVAVPTVV